MRILPNLNYYATKSTQRGTKVDKRTDAALELTKKSPPMSQRQFSEKRGIIRKLVMVTLNRLIEAQKSSAKAR